MRLSYSLPSAAGGARVNQPCWNPVTVRTSPRMSHLLPMGGVMGCPCGGGV
jgi:hypothetical protein